ncbi:MAG TPA: amidohydrolase family protein [Planctomycetaceae bacterium]|nr:amidohydrolase family protein [Planctomycetaceae bacterium]
MSLSSRRQDQWIAPTLNRSSSRLPVFLAVAVGAVAALAPGRLAAQGDRVAGFQPRAFAIRNATVVVKPGESVPRANVVITDGLIVAAGGDAAIPAEAKVIDGTGLFVYAGFIDAGSSTLVDSGRVPPPVDGRAVDFGRYALAASRPDNRRHLSPEFEAREGLKRDTAPAESLRKAGFTSVHVVPSGRIASGHGAFLLTSGDPLRESLLAPTTFAQFALFVPRGDAYPATLMGATAHLRQTLLDARRYADHWRLYRGKAAGIERPPFDPALEALVRVLDRETPAVFAAESRDDVHRALDFAAEFGLRPALWGGREAERCLDRLAGEEVELIVQVDFGDEPKVEPPSKDEKLAADVKDPLRVQEDRRRRWRERVAGLGAFEQRGLRFAVSTEGLKAPADVFANLRLAIREGLSRDAALAALTTSAAAILGFEDRLGTLEPGRLAHVVVLTGPFDHEKSQVRYVLLENQLFEYNEKAKSVLGDPDETIAAPRPETQAVAATPPENDRPVEAPRPAVDRLPTELDSDRLRRLIVTGGNVLIRGGTVLTGTGQTLDDTSILVRGGRIAAIGPDLRPDEGMAVIDATGRFVMPGIIDTHSHIMISGGVNEGTQSIVPEVRIRDVVNTASESEYRALAGGTTAARLFHGSANVIGGQDAVVKLKHGRTAREHVLADAPQGVKFALGENVKFKTARFPNTRLGVEATLNRAFLEAVDYRREWMEHEAALRRDESRQVGGGDGAQNAAERRLAPRRDLRLEALADIVNHQKFIHSHCYRSDEILMLLRVASNLGIRVWSLQHVLEGYKVAPEIVAHGASCSTFADWWAYKVEAYDAIPHNAALLKEAGANVVIKSDDAELVRHLNLEAAKTVRYGSMPPDDALQCVTLNAARELGLQDRIGSIEIGKDADLAIFSGHPLNPFSRCETTLIEGEVYFSRRHAPTAMSAEAAARSASPPPLVFPPAEIRQRKLDLAESPTGRYAIVGATLYPVDAPVIPVGTIVIDGGRIAAIGPIEQVSVPGDAKAIDGAGLHVTPGFIDAGTTLGLVEIGKVRETHDYAESGSLQPDLRAGVGLNPDSELIPVARAGGITTVLVRPTGGIISGQASLARLAGWTAPEMVLDYEAALVINWASGERGKDRQDELRRFLDEGRLYDRLRTEAEREGRRAPIADPRLEALRPYLNRHKPVLIEADSRREIAEALLFAETEKLRIIIGGGTDAWKLADELKARDVPVIVGPVMRAPIESYDPFDAPYANPGRLFEAGVRFCIRSNNASNSRNAPFEAAMAVAHGLPEHEALRAVTLSAAEILGFADQAGSLTPGKQADLIIADGTPLWQTTQIKGAFVAGRPFNAETRQTRFYDRYRQRLEELRRKPAIETAAEASR